ncbi:nitric oxide reductase transcriptional regulator NorR [Vibrio mangrovi]|uniref:Nitric oxide reductase transcriptional regulator NorR n=1 Tax=Vibrio mangrovi TaxID=474394 RepID=A0A1Y6IYF4_9VIBR|nr:nitric oxide reductase transcriptional regulator NorR [Vibrio mangrovi]MDW6005144.1 nitric oxide reductase transcriptional regulator NorR [Vibrio mangrovi]SMS02646.1 Regulatory protein LuxO [Vibrio mangrovi]
MQNFPITTLSTLAEMTIDLASGLNDENRFNRLLETIRKIIPCDCVALMSRQGNTLIPLAMQGLTKDTLGRRFIIDDHPRFQEICSSRQAVRFDTDCTLPDPFDGLLLHHDGDVPIHSCMGLPLIFDEKLLGVLTLDSLKTGVFTHIPTRHLEVLSAIAASTLKMALTFSQLEMQARQSQQRLEELNEDGWERDRGDLIGASSVMQSMNADIEVVASSNFNILIFGETGVGKELVARRIHHLSARKRQPLIYVNCAAIPENLIESELFGHVKGAFTGADRNRLGKFALAHEGTLFLDEIGELPLAAQSKLLRALQNNEIQPVGQDSIQNIDVRVLAATNRDLKQEVEAGRFRADLYHRLSVYPIHVPPLREREGDVSLLAGYFLEQARRKLGMTHLKLAQDVLDYLVQYNWPGNVREMEHVINRAALKAKASQRQQALITIRLTDIGILESVLPDNSSDMPDNTNITTTPSHISVNDGLRQATDDFQRQLVKEALVQSDYNWAQAGRLLQVDRANLTRLAKRLGIQVRKIHKLEM